jgi:hypothetical protein
MADGTEEATADVLPDVVEAENVRGFECFSWRRVC